MRRLGWNRPATAWALAGLMVLLAAACAPLSLMARQNLLAAGGAQIAVAVAFAAVGLVVSRNRPQNPIGWLMLVVGAVSIMFYVDSGLYNVLNYRLGRHLPLAPAVLVLYHMSEPVLGLLPLIILLFPAGRLPSPRWRPAVLGYLTLGLADMAVQGQMSVYALTHHRTQVDTGGQLLPSNHAYSAFFAPVGLTFFAAWLFAVVYQIVRWRRSAGEARQQLNWLMAGGAVALVSFIAGVIVAARHGVWQVVGDVFVIGVVALPAGMGVAILKYRLYEIGDTAAAGGHLAAAAAVFRDGDYLTELAVTLADLADCALAAADLAAADRHAAEAITIAAPRGLVPAQCGALAARARIRAAQATAAADPDLLFQGRDAADAALRLAVRHHLAWHELDALRAHALLDEAGHADHGWAARADALQARLVPPGLDPDPLATVERRVAAQKAAEAGQQGAAEAGQQGSER